MARPPSQFLTQLAAEGFSGAGALRQLRESGYTFGDQAFYQAWGQSLADVYRSDLEAGGGLEQLPTFGEMGPAPVQLSAQYLQKVVLSMVDQETGAAITRIVSISTDELMTRQDAIDFALDMFQQHADRYGVDLTGGTYVATQYAT